METPKFKIGQIVYHPIKVPSKASEFSKSYMTYEVLEIIATSKTYEYVISDLFRSKVDESALMTKEECIAYMKS